MGVSNTNLVSDAVLECANSVVCSHVDLEPLAGSWVDKHGDIGDINLSLIWNQMNWWKVSAEEYLYSRQIDMLRDTCQKVALHGTTAYTDDASILCYSCAELALQGTLSLPPSFLSLPSTFFPPRVCFSYLVMHLAWGWLVAVMGNWSLYYVPVMYYIHSIIHAWLLPTNSPRLVLVHLLLITIIIDSIIISSSW